MILTKWCVIGIKGEMYFNSLDDTQQGSIDKFIESKLLACRYNWETYSNTCGYTCQQVKVTIETIKPTNNG